jgi:nucleoside-diphosphate-sugar epimerase
VAAVDVSLFDREALSRVVAGHDIVINLATRIPPSSRTFLPGAWRENSRIRRVGSSNLTAAALSGGVERFIQESFAPIYSDGGDDWLDENAPIKPARYNAAVVDAEAAAARFAGSGRMGVALRFAFFYGPDSGFLIDMIRYIRKGLAPAFGSPHGFISSISHDDAASAVMVALEVPSGLYNVADDEPVRRREFYDSLAEALGVKPPGFPPAWLAGIFGSIGDTLARSQRISNRKFRHSSTWSPSVPSVTQAWPVVLGQLRSQ